MLLVAQREARFPCGSCFSRHRRHRMQLTASQTTRGSPFLPQLKEPARVLRFIQHSHESFVFVVVAATAKHGCPSTRRRCQSCQQASVRELRERWRRATALGIACLLCSFPEASVVRSHISRVTLSLGKTKYTLSWLQHIEPRIL